MLDLSSFQSVEDSLKTTSAPQPELADIVDLSNLAPVSEPTIGDKVVTAAAKVKESVGSLYDKATGQETPERVNIIPTSAESDMVKRQEMAKAKHLENLNTDMSYYLDAVKLGDPDALKLDPGTVAIQSAKKQTAEQGLNTSFIDPLMWPLENAVATGALKGLASVYDSIKMNKSVRTFMERLKPNEAEEMTNTLKFMEEHGISPTDALVQGSKGSDLGQFIGGHNVFGVRDAFNASETLANDYFKMVLGVTDKIKANGVDLGDIKTWRDITKAQKEVKEGVENLRKTYKDREAVAYGEVSKLVKSLPDEYEVGAFHTDVIKQLADEGVPPEAVGVVKNIFNRFAKPYADETKELSALKKNRISLQTEAKSLSMKQNEALKAGDTLEANRLEQAIDDNAQALKDLAGKEQELKDVRYMNTEELMSSIKLINRRLYKPGGAISLKDADELRGLQIAKSRMEEFLESKLPDGELKQKIREAKDITIARTTLFGAKDMGGEKALLANILNQGDFTKIGKYLTGPEAKENIVFIRDTFGKDSEVYKTSLGHYLTDKLGMTPEGLTQLLDTKKVFGISDRVNLQQAAAKISTLDAQDFSLVRQVAGKDAALDLKSIQRLTQNFADLENAAEKYGRGITAGKLAYVEGDANILGMAGRGLKLVKDAVMYQSAKTAEKIIYNQPKFRTLTGALTGETIYLANNEDKDLTIEGILGSLVGGGVGGYYGGRATRSLLESDINKITRYLKSGAEFGENMPKGLIDSLTRLGAQARQFEGEAMDIASETAQKAGLRPVGEAAYNTAQRVQRSIGLPPTEPQIIDITKYSTPTADANSVMQTALRQVKEGYINSAIMTIKESPIESRQGIVDTLFSSRNMEEAKGLTGNQTKSDIKYFGFTTKMLPNDFLKLASDRRLGPLDRVNRKTDFAKNILNDLVSKEEGVSKRIGAPFLKLEITDDGIKVVGHEGRHRSDAINALFGNDISVPVDITSVVDKRGKPLRRADLSNDILELPLISQDGKKLNRTLRDLMPEDMKALPIEGSQGVKLEQTSSKTSGPAGLEETNSLTVGNAPKKKMPIEEGYDNLEDFINQNDDVYEAVIDYTGDSFKKINLNYLKGKPNETLEKLFAMEGDYYGKAYRGTHLDTKKLMELQEGDLIENKMPLSSSSDDFGPELYIENKKSSRKNVSKAVLEIDTKYVPQYDISKFAQLDEGEVLISPRTLLQVEEIDKSGPIVKVKLNAVHNDIQDIIAKHKGQAIKDLMSLTGGAILTKETFGTKAEAKDVETKDTTTEAQGNGIEDVLATASSKATILKDLPIKKVETYDKATEVFYRNKDAKGLADYLNKIPDESYRQWFRAMAGIPEDTKITEASIKAAGK